MQDLLIIYHKALMSLAILCIAILLQGVLVAPLGFSKGVEQPGIPLKGQPKDFDFRVIRTYHNSVENLPAFLAVLLLAIFAGVSPFWVNMLAAIHVVARITFWAIYYSTLGIKTPGLRTLSYVIGWLSNFVLAIMVVPALIH